MLVCLFDIDGTLVNTGGAGQSAMEGALAEEFGISMAVADIPTAGRTDRAIGVDLFALHGLDAEGEPWRRFVESYLRRLPESLQQRQGRILPGIPLLLERLSSREDVGLGLLTGNFREGAVLKLAHYGIDHHFAFGGFGDDHLDRDNVARDALAEVHRRLDGSVDLQRLWVIGDTPYDVRCGRAIGARVVAVATGSFDRQELQAARPDHLFEDFANPQPLLRLLT